MIYGGIESHVGNLANSVGVRTNQKEEGRNNGKSKCSLRFKGISREG